MKEKSLQKIRETLIYSLKNYQVTPPDKLKLYANHSLSLALSLYFANWLNPKSKNRNKCFASTSEIASALGKKWQCVKRLLSDIEDLISKNENGKWCLSDDIEAEIKNGSVT